MKSTPCILTETTKRSEVKRSEAETHSRGDIREVRTSDGTPFARAKTGGARTAILVLYANGDAINPLRRE